MFNNDGTTNVQDGTLGLTRGGTSTGAFTVQSLGTLGFGNLTHDLTTGSSVSGAGDVNFFSGTTTVGDGYAITGTTTVSGSPAPTITPRMMNRPSAWRRFRNTAFICRRFVEGKA